MTAQRTRTRRRILLLPVEIAGWAARIASGMQEIGWDAGVLDLTGDPYAYGAQPTRAPSLERLRSAHACAGRFGPPGRLLARILLLPLRLHACRVAVRDHDALVLLFGRSLLAGLDLRLARRRGVRTVAVFLGGDARPPWMDGDHVGDEHVAHWPLVRLRTWLTARRVRAMERLADVIVCHPSYCHFLERHFVNWLALGMPVDIPDAEKPRSTREDGDVVVLHAPTRRLQKGTQLIEAAIARLAHAGLPVRYETLSGLPTGEVRRRLGEADVVVDQLWSDTLLAGLSSEASAEGALPLVFGYAGDVLVAMADQLGIPHRHFASPEELEERLEKAVTDRSWREQVAAETAGYVRNHCAPRQVAARLARVIDDEIPPEWWVDPATVSYLDGYGMSQERARTRLREFVNRYGEAALGLPARSAALAAVRERLRAESVAGERI